MSINFKLANVCQHSSGPCKKEKLLSIISNAGANKFKECFRERESYICMKGLVKRIFTTELDNEDKLFCLECYLSERNFTGTGNFGAIVNLHWLTKDSHTVKDTCFNCEITLLTQEPASNCDFCMRESILHEDWLDMFGIVNVRTTNFNPIIMPESGEDIYVEMNSLPLPDFPKLEQISKDISKLSELSEELSKRKKPQATYTMMSYDNVVRQHTVMCKIDDMTFKGKGTTHIQAKAEAASKAIKAIAQRKKFFLK